MKAIGYLVVQLFINGCCISKSAQPRTGSTQVAYSTGHLRVTVALETPNALERGAFAGCEPGEGWRPELVAPIVSYLTSDVLKPHQRIREVAIFDVDAMESNGTIAKLGNDEFAVSIDPKVLILYDHSHVMRYCITVAKTGDLFVRLDLFSRSGSPARL